MKLSDDRFFGPQAFTTVIGLQPIPATRWGYEAGNALYDIVVLSRPVQGQRVYAKVNGSIHAGPYTPFHRAIAARFDLPNRDFIGT